MGMNEVDEEVTVRIGENVDYLNEEFEGMIKFELDKLVMDPNHAYIPDLHRDHIRRNRNKVNRLLRPVESAGAINIYLFETYSKDDQDMAMMGFTPVLSKRPGEYEHSSPQFDRLYIAYPGLIDRSTIVHEMGHFLGLSHPWEMDISELERLDLNNPDEDRNHMTYHPFVDHFNEAQLQQMQDFAMTYRKYLISEVEIKYILAKANQSYTSLED